MFYYYYDWTYILVVIGAVICIAASARVKNVFSRYSRIQSHSGLTGREAAEQILHRNGIYDVQVIHIGGNLTDHYNPGNKTLGLSDTVYNSTSVAAIGVAAHECGQAAWPLILIGLFMNGQTAIFFINLGILLFSAAVLFQIVTLPVEFNASGRAVKVLESSGMLYPDEVDSVKKVLGAAALTYVASAASMILQLLRLVIIGGRKRK